MSEFEQTPPLTISDFHKVAAAVLDYASHAESMHEGGYRAEAVQAKLDVEAFPLILTTIYNSETARPVPVHQDISLYFPFKGVVSLASLDNRDQMSYLFSADIVFAERLKWIAQGLEREKGDDPNGHAGAGSDPHPCMNPNIS